MARLFMTKENVGIRMDQTSGLIKHYTEIIQAYVKKGSEEGLTQEDQDNLESIIVDMIRCFSVLQKDYKRYMRT